MSNLFPLLLDALLEVLSGLGDDGWNAPLARSEWTVKDTALHLLGDEIGILSRQRDDFQLPGEPAGNWAELVARLNRWNEEWLRAARRMSPQVLCDLLRFTGTQACAHFAQRARNPFALGDPVSWAGPAPAPVWLDLAREYTERWHHQQYMREALHRPGLLSPQFLAPALATFVHALPHTYRTVHAEAGTLVALSVTGESGGRWCLRREQATWRLYVDPTQAAVAEVAMPKDVAWRLFTRGLSQSEALAASTLRGDEHLARQMLETLAIIA